MQGDALMNKPQPWEVAARLEDAANAVMAASKALDAAYSILLNYAGIDAPDGTELPEWSEIRGTDFVDRSMSNALQALSDEYQAIADAEIGA